MTLPADRPDATGTRQRDRAPSPAPAAPAPEPAAADAEANTSIARSDLESVIRRAVDLSLAEHDGEERLTEDEVVRVATELGLPERLARQALYEMPALDAAPSAFTSTFGTAIVAASRCVPGDALRVRDRIEDYLGGHEYLRLLRRRSGRLHFVPAEDTLSSLARGLLRPRSRYHLARARRVVLDVRPLDDQSSHVQIATDFTEQRRSAIQSAFVGGTFVAAVGAGLGALVAHGLTAFAVPSNLPEIVGAAGGFGASMWGAVKYAGYRFRSRMLEAKTELDGLLDRAEHGDRLEPPPAPWRRRLQQRMQGN
jgi:hypothetical protein